MYNPAGYPPPPPVSLSRGMAIASLVIGIVSVVTLGGLCVGPLLGLVFGIIAIYKASGNPAVYGGKGLAIAGIVLSIMSPGPGIIAAIAIPNLLKSRQAANEAMAIGSIRTIANAEATHQADKGNFVDLGTLAAEGLIDSVLGSGTKSGYMFRCTAFEDADGTQMFDAVAIPLSIGQFGTGNRSFGCNETYVIYTAPGQVELKGTPTDREPPGGTAISRNTVPGNLLGALRQRMDALWHRQGTNLRCDRTT